MRYPCGPSSARSHPLSTANRPSRWSHHEDPGDRDRDRDRVLRRSGRLHADDAGCRPALRRRQGDDRGRRLRRVHREPARCGDVRPRARARGLHGGAAVRPPGAGGLADRVGVGADRSQARIPVVAAVLPGRERGAFERSRSGGRTGSCAPRAGRDLRADAVTGAGHERVRGEQRDGPTVRAHDDDVARRCGEPADGRGAAGMSTAPVLSHGPAGHVRHPLLRLRATRCGWPTDRRGPQDQRHPDRSVVLHRPKHRGERVRPAWSTTGICRMPRTSRR